MDQLTDKRQNEGAHKRQRSGERVADRGAVQRWLDFGQGLLQITAAVGEDHFLFVAEVSEERRPADLRPGGYVSDSYSVETAFGEQSMCRLDDRLPRTLLLAVA
nr:hypothetical protein [Nocardia amikacinitolerans]